MKLQIIGSGAIINPEASASALIDDEILIDCGAGVFKQLLKLGYKLEKINTVLITHLHSDHFADIPFIILAAKLSRNENQKLTIFLPDGGIKAAYDISKYLFDLDDAAETWWPQNIELIEYQGGEVLARDNATIESVAVVHGNMKASGFIVEKDGKKVGFSGDSVMCDGINKILETADWALLDATWPYPGYAAPVHMSLEDIYQLCNRYPNKKIVATHMSTDAKTAARRDIPNLIIPEDGAIFEV